MRDRRFKITLRVKPYVWQFLVNNFQDSKNPEVGIVNFKQDPELNNVLKKMLCKKTSHFNGRYLSALRYNREIRVIISQDDFERYGWELSPTDTVQLGRIIEKRAKQQLYSYISFYHSINRTIQDAILKAQETFHYSEEVWPADSIRRGYARNRPELLNLSKLLDSEIDNIFLGKLSHNWDKCNIVK